MRPTAPAINDPQPSASPFGESAYVIGHGVVARSKVAGDICKPGFCEMRLMNTYEGAAVCPANWLDGGGDLSELSEAGQPLPPDPAIEREAVVTELGQYLFDQMKAYPQLADWIAGNLIAHLVRVGKRPDMPGAVRALIDVTIDVEAIVTLPPAGPPTPPGRRWNLIRRWVAGRVLVGSLGWAVLAGVALWLYEGLSGWHG
jgi:hypothetical protein